MKYLLTFFIFLNTLNAQEGSNSLSFKETYKLLQTVDDKAIVMGSGQKDVFVFIDPQCRFSRKFIQTVTTNSFMLKKYKYHLFLYEIPRLHSKNIIYHIYHKKRKLDALLKIMRDEITPEIKNINYTKEKHLVDSIAKVAQTLHVKKRPHIIISQKRSR